MRLTHLHINARFVHVILYHNFNIILVIIPVDGAPYVSCLGNRLVPTENYFKCTQHMRYCMQGTLHCLMPKEKVLSVLNHKETTPTSIIPLICYTYYMFKCTMQCLFCVKFCELNWSEMLSLLGFINARALPERVVSLCCKTWLV